MPKKHNILKFAIAQFLVVLFFIPSLITTVHNLTHNHDIVCLDKTSDTHLHKISNDCNGDIFYHRTIDYVLPEFTNIYLTKYFKPVFRNKKIPFVSVYRSFQNLRAPPVLV